MPTPLVDYLKVQKATDQQVLGALRASAESIERELRRLQGRTGTGALVRSHQLAMAQASIQREMGTLWTRVGDVTAAQKAQAAATAAEGAIKNSDVLSTLFSAADRDYMARSAAETASRGLAAVERRLEGSSYVPLSESVYNNAALSSGRVDDLVNAALARGASAAELARDIRGYVNPETPGGVRYASMRLARSEINNSFHASQVKQAQEEPWTTGLKWNLSGSHPVPDECNQYAEQTHYEGGDPGVFEPEKAPGKPHPNCLCYTTSETVDPEEFVKQFEEGRYDDYLDSQYPDVDTDAAASKAANSPLPTSTKPVNKVGSDAFNKEIQAAERQRQALEKAQYIQKGRGKGNLNPVTGYDVPGARRALSQYTEMGYQDMNLLKRNPDAFRAANDDFWVEHIASQNDLIENLLEKNALDEDITVARLMTGNFDDLREGGFLADPAFLSTTTDSSVFLGSPSAAFTSGLDAGEKAWTFIIRAPKGTKALPGADYQKEIIFGPGTKQRILSIDRTTNTVYTEII